MNQNYLWVSPYPRSEVKGTVETISWVIQSLPPLASIFQQAIYTTVIGKKASSVGPGGSGWAAFLAGIHQINGSALHLTPPSQKQSVLVKATGLDHSSLFFSFSVQPGVR